LRKEVNGLLKEDIIRKELLKELLKEQREQKGYNEKKNAEEIKK
tara:strand:+ start:1175 stop:1306 length:132 start_codon:yes stop_codon:yes gene_type:complete